MESHHNSSSKFHYPHPPADWDYFYDPIWDLVREYEADERPSKREFLTGQLLLSDRSVTSSLVKQSAQVALGKMVDFAALLPEGNHTQLENFLKFLSPLLFLESHLSLQSCGATGGLFLAMSWLRGLKMLERVFISDPSWENHRHILDMLDANIIPFPVDMKHVIGYERMLAKISAGDAVLLQPCCHNPTGQSYSDEEWDSVAENIAASNSTVVFDASYLGFGDGITVDIRPVEKLVEKGCTVILVVGCSKLFGIYSERVGCVYIFNATNKMLSGSAGMIGIIRGAYSSPPSFGLSIIDELIISDKSRITWMQELDLLRDRMNRMRRYLADKLHEIGFDAPQLRLGKGPFAILPITKGQISKLKTEFGVYLLENGRISFARILNERDVDYLVLALKYVICT